MSVCAHCVCILCVYAMCVGTRVCVHVCIYNWCIYINRWLNGHSVSQTLESPLDGIHPDQLGWPILSAVSKESRPEGLSPGCMLAPPGERLKTNKASCDWWGSVG